MAEDEGPIVPLRPYGLGAMYAGMVQVLRAAPSIVIGAALLGFALTALLDSVAGPTEISTRSTGGYLTRTTIHTRYGPTAVSALDVFAVVAVAAVLVPLTLRLVAGQRPVGAFDRAGIRAGAAYVLLALLSIPETVLFSVGGGRTAYLDLGGLLAVVLLYVSVRLAVLPAVLAVEGQSFAAGLRRSWSLVRGSWWRALGLTIMFDLVQIVGGAVLSGVTLVTDAHRAPGTTYASPTREAAVGLALLALLALPMGTIGRALLYVDLRCRREGLAWQLDAARRDPARPAFGPAGTYAAPPWERAAHPPATS